MTSRAADERPAAPHTERQRQNYIKALDFSEKGYPHLHVLFFDVPTRREYGMPWLCDKPELASKWADYGQGEIVDVYPLTYRDDLEDLEAAIERALSEVETPAVRSTLPEEASFRCIVNYRGAYAYWTSSAAKSTGAETSNSSRITPSRKMTCPSSTARTTHP